MVIVPGHTAHDHSSVSRLQPVAAPGPATGRQNERPNAAKWPPAGSRASTGGDLALSAPSGSSRLAAYGRLITRSGWRLERACIKLEMPDERIAELV